MKKIYEEYFEISDNKPLSTKVFSMRIMMSFIIIVACLSMASLSAYAYFSYTISSKNNVIVSATYSHSVVNKEGIKSDNNVYTLTNETDNDKTYHFIVSKSTNSTAKAGYGRIIINDNEYYTSPIGEYENKVVNDRYYSITVSANTTYTVRFIGEWGSCSKTAINGTGIIKEITFEQYQSAVTTNITDENINDEQLDQNIPNNELSDQDNQDNGNTDIPDNNLDDNNDLDNNLDNNQSNNNNQTDNNNQIDNNNSSEQSDNNQSDNSSNQNNEVQNHDNDNSSHNSNNLDNSNNENIDDVKDNHIDDLSNDETPVSQ